MFLLKAVLAAAAKIAGASTVAQVTAGVGLTVASVTGAGAAGVLPTPVQDGVAHAVEAVTPFNLPDSSDAVAPVHHEASGSAPAVTSTAPSPVAAAEVAAVSHETGDDAAVPAPATHEAEQAENTDRSAEKAQKSADKAAEKAQRTADKAVEKAHRNADKAARTHAEDATETEHEGEHTATSSTATSGEQESHDDGGHSAPAPSGSASSGSRTSGSGSGSGGHHGGDD